MNRGQLLEAAAVAVDVRGDRYGDPAVAFERIAQLWTAILERPITVHEVALCMAALKIARLVEAPQHDDSWVDLAGYAACGAEVVSRGD
jgi:hypothetical protein